MRLRGLLDHLTYANVIATLALFIAVGGTSYAALRIGSGEIVDNSVRSRDLRNNGARGIDIHNFTITWRDVKRDALGGERIREAGLGPVPLARDAERLSGLSIFDLRLHCPDGTVAKAAVCVEPAPRSATAFHNAMAVCGNVGRRLPDYGELAETQRTGGSIAASGEWTSSVYRNPTTGSDPSDQLEVVVVTTDSEGITYKLANTPEQLPYRCVVLPSN